MPALNQLKKFAVTLSDTIFGSPKTKVADKNKSSNAPSSGAEIKENGSLRIIADKQARPKQQLSDFTLF